MAMILALIEIRIAGTENTINSLLEEKRNILLVGDSLIILEPEIEITSQAESQTLQDDSLADDM